ncbi:MAG: RnfH family protein [Gammaproteobacteria bacterium]|jgi:putative ubiquitin-RnfH superfamily antitoxin RatB of RatAB toxin-antitoxin module|nr:RnfH family protein [Gammaproteobacteria bacterium]
MQNSLKMLSIEVAYALPDHQWLIPLQVCVGTSVIEAIRLSGILSQCKELDATVLRLGIYGRSVDPDTILQNHDRVEIYRPLLVDPKQKRIIRAKSQK